MQTSNRGFLRLAISQAQVAFNDNATKLVLMGLAQMVLSPANAARTISLLALLMVTPFVLFAPLAGWLADRFPKRDVVLASLGLQLAVMAMLLVSIVFRRIECVLIGFFLLGTQATIFSPSKRGLVKELIPSSGIASAVGIMEMLSIVCVLLGSVCGGKLIDGLTIYENNPWSGAWTSILVLSAACACAFLGFWGVPRRSAETMGNRFHWKILTSHLSQISELHHHPGLFRAALGDAAFYFTGGILTLTLTQVGSQAFTKGVGAAGETGVMLALLGGGIACGSVLTARISRGGIRLGLVPVGALGMSAMLFALAFFLPRSLPFYVLLGGLGIFAGLYLIPLDAWMVDRSPEGSRGRILAASGLLSSLMGMVAVGFHWIMAQTLHFSIAFQFITLAVMLLFVTAYILRLLPDEFLRTVALAFAGMHYRVKSRGSSVLPSSGGALIVCNHITYVDAFALSLASPRPIRFLSDEGLFSVPCIGSLLRIFKCIPVSPNHARKALQRAAEAVRAGELVCIFPEGQLTRNGELNELKSGFEVIARLAKCPIIAARIDGLWGSIFSFDDGRYFSKLPKKLLRQTVVSFAKPMNFDEVDIPSIRAMLSGARMKCSRSASKFRKFKYLFNGKRKTYNNPARRTVRMASSLEGIASEVGEDGRPRSYLGISQSRRHRAGYHR